MLEVRWNETSGWGKPRIVPLHDIAVHPFNSTLHYALQGFDGFKVFRDPQGKLRTFRPDAHAARFNKTNQTLGFPTFDPTEFVKCVDELIKTDEKWVPAASGALYIRPTMVSMTNSLELRPPRDALLYVASSPCDPVPVPLPKPINIKIESVGARTWIGGSGDVKAGANYGLGIKYMKGAEAAGLDQTMWLSNGHIVEMDTCNVFILWVDKWNRKELVTPALDGSVLPGITRDSIIQLLRNDSRFHLTEKTIPVSNLVKAHKDKKVKRPQHRANR